MSHTYQAQPDELQGRVIAITGAGEGIGAAVAVAAAEHGAQVILIGRTVKKLEAVHARIAQLKQCEATIAPLDLEKAIARDYDQLADALMQRYGRLDGLLHNAALLGAPAPIEQYDVPTWCKVLHVNLTAAFALTQVLLPALRAARDASIVFTTASQARAPSAYWGAYAVSKSAVETLAQVLADEVEHLRSVRVNVVDPGPTRTRLRRQAFPAEEIGNMATPEQIVRPYLWLFGGASQGVSGQCIECQPDTGPTATSP
jgi:NAD(P)-dependent dehydrogenase (short-subunit alcohol dehydrogenase family)